MSQQCSCKKGYASLVDGKCSNCRTKREQQTYLNRPSKQLLMTVVNKHHGTQGEYIGRGSPLGNPFPITQQDPRAVVIDKYKVWLDEQIQKNNPVVIKELQRLGDLALSGPVCFQCFCAPAACHGDVIKRTLFEAIIVNYPETHWWVS